MLPILAAVQYIVQQNFVHNNTYLKQPILVITLATLNCAKLPIISLNSMVGKTTLGREWLALEKSYQVLFAYLVRNFSYVSGLLSENLDITVFVSNSFYHIT